MSDLVLYGSPTSPYVRRVRIVAHELGVSLRFIDSRLPETQERLRALTPIGKVPVLETAEGAIFDSHEIVDWLVARYGPGPLRPETTRRVSQNFAHVTDGALDAAIRLFYAQRDGVPLSAPFLARETQRLEACLAWLEAHVPDVAGRGAEDVSVSLSVNEVALVTVLDWLRYRGAADLGACPRLSAFAHAVAERPAFRETAPSETMPDA